MRDIFATYHPIINLIFFVMVIGVSMFVMHPVYMAISFSAAFVYSVIQQGIRKTVKFNIILMLPMMLFVTAINPLFNHYGDTILFRLPEGRPITLEAMIYGFALAGILAEVVLWFSCYNKVVTSDKFIYLFGRVIPSMSLVLSMCMRFVPKFMNQAKVIANGQKCIGRDISSGSLMARIRHGITILSILVTWALENAIDTADSMKARGYGMKGRTAFSVFRFDARDRLFFLAECLLAAGTCIGIGAGNGASAFIPSVKFGGLPITWGSIVSYLLFAVFAYLPVILNVVDSFKWIQIRREIRNRSRDIGGFRVWEY